MLQTILGNETAAKVMLYIFHYESAYATAISKEMDLTLSQVQKQLEKFEQGGVLLSAKIGNTRLYKFNTKLGVVRKFINMIEAFYESIPLKQREVLFKSRKRPRRKGKPVL